MIRTLAFIVALSAPSFGQSVVAEGFEGAGYENSWTETIGSGNTVDEDDTSVTPPTSGGSQTLNTVGAGTNLDAYTSFDSGGAQDADNYICFYFRFATIDTADTDNLWFFSLHGPTLPSLGLAMDSVSSNPTLRIYYYDGSTTQADTRVISASTWYRYEAQYNSQGSPDAWAGALYEGDSGTPLESWGGTLTSARTDARYLRLGMTYTDAARADDINFDRVGWDQTTYTCPATSSGNSLRRRRN